MQKSQKDSVNDMKSDQDSISNKDLLSHKRKRDSNISSEIVDLKSSPNNEIRCSICLGKENLVPNIYKCNTCSAYFHLECYNLFSFEETKEEVIFLENTANFECFRCKEEKKNGQEINCFMCKNHTGILKKYRENEYIHHYCYVFFKDNLDGSKGGSCKVCSHKKIPVLKCQNIKCKEKYHIQCAIDKDIIFWLPYMREEEGINPNKFNEKINFYCKEHNDALIKNFNEYSLTMIISQNDKNPNEKINEENDNNIKSNNKINEITEKIIPKQEINDNNNIEIKKDDNDNKDNNKESNINLSLIKDKKESAEKINKEKENEKGIIKSVINLKINNNNNMSDSNLNLRNTDTCGKEDKEKNNSINNDLNTNSNKNNENVDSSPKTPVKINLGKNKSLSSSIKASIHINNDYGNALEKKESSIINNIDDDEDDFSIKLDKVNSDIKEEIIEDDDEDVEYNPPEIKYEDIDLFGNYRNKNEKYVLPFFKSHF